MCKHVFIRLICNVFNIYLCVKQKIGENWTITKISRLRRRKHKLQTFSSSKQNFIKISFSLNKTSLVSLIDTIFKNYAIIKNESLLYENIFLQWSYFRFEHEYLLITFLSRANFVDTFLLKINKSIKKRERKYRARRMEKRKKGILRAERKIKKKEILCWKTDWVI